MGKGMHMTAFILLVIGGLNWGLYGLFGGLNIVNMVLGSIPFLENIVYILVGLSAIYLLATHKGHCKECSKGAGSVA